MNTKDGMGEGRKGWKSAPMFLLAYLIIFLAMFKDLTYINWVTYRILNIYKNIKILKG